MIRLIKSSFYQEAATKRKLNAFLNSTTRLSMGSECQKFEEGFAKWQGRKYAFFYNSGSSANLALLQALLNMGTLQKGDMVGFSATTWATNVMPIIQLGLTPIPIDIELETLNVSSETLGDVIKEKKLKAVFITNVYSLCHDLDKIAKLCKRHKIVLIEDNCESLGSVYKGKKLGNFGLAATFSTFVGHHFSTIEGGVVTTDDARLATMLKMVRAHGWTRNLSETEKKTVTKGKKSTSSFYEQFTFYDLGYNLRPTEIQGFLGNVQLPHLDTLLEKRVRTFTKMAEAIYAHTDRFIPLQYGHMDFVPGFCLPIIARTPQVQRKLVARLEKVAEVRPITGGNMTEQPFFKKYAKQSKPMKNASYLHAHGLFFSNDAELTNTEVRTLIDACTGPL